MRLFTAIPLPGHVRSELALLQPQHPDIHLVPESQIHLTLRFIGEVDKAKTRRIVASLSQVNFRPFDITLMGTGCFPNPKNPLILWSGVQYHETLRELYDAVQEQLYRAGGPPENRPFHPHVTLGRVRKGRRSKERLERSPPSLDGVMENFLNGKNSRFATTFHVDRYRLYHSRLHSGGAIHHCLHEYPGT